jgi:hypothetical protein
MKADEYKELVSKVTPEPHESKTIWAETSIELCEKKTWTGEPDDVYFSISDLTKPTLEEACEFAVNHIKHPDPIGCHQVWIHDEEFVRSLFK